MIFLLYLIIGLVWSFGFEVLVSLISDIKDMSHIKQDMITRIIYVLLWPVFIVIFIYGMHIKK